MNKPLFRGGKIFPVVVPFLLHCCPTTRALAIPHETSATLAVGNDGGAAVSAHETASTKDWMIPILQTVQDEYELELQQGFATFGDGVPHTTNTAAAWGDDDFVVYNVGKGNSGPDESVLTCGDCIFRTVAPVLSDDECEALILEAKKVIADGLMSDSLDENAGSASVSVSHSQLGEARVSQLPMARAWLRHVLHTRFFPLLSSRFGIPVDDLTLHDGLVIGHGFPSNDRGSRSQPIHRDSCLLSLNVALSRPADYQGGGTLFEALPVDVRDRSDGLSFGDGSRDDEVNGPSHSTLYSERGHVMCHAGGISHAGRGIDGGGGERWILVLFCIAKNYPEVARRCHAQGMRDKEAGNLALALQTFQTGLHFAPVDHLLQTSLGGVYMSLSQSNKEGSASLRLSTKARVCLAMAAQNYAHCIKANMALGRTYLASGKPRAALRRFELVLGWLEDRDLRHAQTPRNANENSTTATADYSAVWGPYRAIGYDARVSGARAALWCASQAQSNPVVHATFDVRHCVEKAVGWLKISLQAAPGDDQLLDMLGFAQDLLSKFQSSSIA
jgi:hypothetical protein